MKQHRKVSALALAVLMVSFQLLLAGCTKKQEYPGLETALHTILDCPQDDLLLLMMQRDNRLEVQADGSTNAEEVQNSEYHTTLRQLLSPHFTEEAMVGCIAYVGDYYQQSYLTGQRVMLDGIAYQADPQSPGKVSFTVTATHTDPSGNTQALEADGYAYLDQDGRVNTFYLGGGILHELEKTPWVPGELPPLPDGSIPYAQ